ncbi:hypothetical protein BVX98_00935 [bacterium F11]|nr:hypothetical protein BVX98_00935 [bacterium F11]
MTALRQKMIDEMQLRNFAERTQEAYLFAVKRLALYYRRSPEKINEKEVHDYLRYEMIERKLSVSSINQKINGLIFFYREVLKRPRVNFLMPPRRGEQKLPEVLSLEEVERLFNATRSPKYRAIFKTAYAGGLRLGEVLQLRVTDIDSSRMMIRVEQGKGNKDRYVKLSTNLLQELREYWKRDRPKRWLFEGRMPDESLGETSVQKAYKKAKAEAGIKKEGGIHTLRHCYATHLLEAGETDLRTIQVMMGHGSIVTTSRYLRIANQKLSGTPSPYDLIKRRKRR